MKSQGVRLLDVFFLGPIMVAAGIQGRSLTPAMRATLFVGGVLTVTYNWRNYVDLASRVSHAKSDVWYISEG